MRKVSAWIREMELWPPILAITAVWLIADGFVILVWALCFYGNCI